MDNSLITKLIKKINFDLADKFELSKAKELSFVPVNMQKDVTTGEEVFFVAVYSNTNGEAVKSYIKTILSNEVKFIHMTKSNFELLFDAFLKKFSAQYGDTIPSINDSQDELEISDDEDGIEINLNSDDDSLDIDDDINLDDDSSDDIDDSSDSYDDKDDLFVDDEEENQNSAIEILPEAPAAKTKEVSEEDSAIKKVQAPQTKKLGEILIEENLINEKQLEIALAESKVQKIPLGSIMVKLGFVKMKDLKEALGENYGAVALPTIQKSVRYLCVHKVLR